MGVFTENVTLKGGRYLVMKLEDILKADWVEDGKAGE